MTRLLHNYVNTFKGLSREIWWLALITLVNRAGAMVIPFLSLYLQEGLSFTKSHVGWIMSAYGLGALLGTWLGGKLSDRIGYYKVILYSLIFTGINFLWAMHVTNFYHMCLAFFVLIAMADMGRPAFFVALSAYSKPENKTRSLTLIRLAINLGFSAGPAVGGFLIATLGYNALFYVDGVTCILAAILMTQVLHPKKAKVLDEEKPVSNPLPPHKDSTYMMFIIAFTLFGIIFLQYFSTIPLFYKEIHGLSEEKIGLILAMNGALIFILEMPLIAWMERKKFSAIKSIIFGLVLTGLSFMLLLMEFWVGMVVIGMLIATIGEMVSFPFSNKLALDRSKLGRQGAYMGLYSMSFAMANIFGHNGGMQITQYFGFKITWIVMGGITIVAWILLYMVQRRLSNKTTTEPVSLSS